MALVAFRTLKTRIIKAVRALIPMGYEDESGFHFGGSSHVS